MQTRCATPTRPAPTPRRPHLKRTLLALTLAGTLSLTACLPGFSKDSEKQSAENAAATNPLTGAKDTFPAALKPFYEQKLKWEKCQDKRLAGLECATAQVPLDYAHPDGQHIEIHMAKSSARKPKLKKGTLFINPGGPGGSGMILLSNSQGMISRAVFDNFDVVGFDPRGVGKSSPVVCFTDEERDAFLAQTLNFSVPGTREKAIARTREVGERCAELSGDIYKHVGTENAARDLDILRQAVGDNKLTYLGYSYGSFLGQTYASLFPTRVGRLVLDGVLDGSLSYEQVAAAQAQGFEESLRNFAQWRVDQGNSPWSTAEQGLEKIKHLFTLTGASDLQTSSPERPLTGGLAQTAIVGMMYREQFYATLGLALDSALLQKDGNNLLSLADQVNYRAPDGHYTLNSPDAFMAINALDYPVTGTPAAWDAFSAQLIEKFPVMGPSMVDGNYLLQAWPVHSSAKREPLLVDGVPPIMLVGSLHDPATPYAMAQSVHGQIKNSRLITVDSYTHTSYGADSTCVSSTVDAYLIDGIAPEKDLDCKDN